MGAYTVRAHECPGQRVREVRPTAHQHHGAGGQVEHIVEGFDEDGGEVEQANGEGLRRWGGGRGGHCVDLRASVRAVGLE